MHSLKAYGYTHVFYGICTPSVWTACSEAPQFLPSKWLPEHASVDQLHQRQPRSLRVSLIGPAPSPCSTVGRESSTSNCWKECASHQSAQDFISDYRITVHLRSIWGFYNTTQHILALSKSHSLVQLCKEEQILLVLGHPLPMHLTAWCTIQHSTRTAINS